MRSALPPAFLLALFSLAPCGEVQAQWSEGGKAVVANRGSGCLSVIDARRAKVVKTVALPGKGGTRAEPMYVVQAAGDLWVGDRAHDRVLRLDDRSFKLLGEVKVGKGVFHMWADPRQLWVVNDLDRTTSVVDLRKRKVVRTIKMPADLEKKGYKPHDVWVAYGFAWVSMVKGGSPGYVVNYSTRSYKMLRKAKVGGDPHLWLDVWTGQLLVASQGAGRLEVLHPLSLKQLHKVPLKGAHGIFSPRFSRTLYVTNLPGGGKKDILGLRLGWSLGHKPVLRSVTDSGVPVAHNLAASPFGTRLFATHSGATADKVTVYRPTGWPWWPTGLKKIATLKVGMNPFGLAYVR